MDTPVRAFQRWGYSEYVEKIKREIEGIAEQHMAEALPGDDCGKTA